MVFITLLVLTTTFIAGAAAFFSVYGLAATFSGTFWSVVLMGSSLEAGKLIAASYLYRYWKQTNVWLKTYLMAGILTLMVLTSTGIFGYLSSGYQTDVLPLKQVEEQVKLLEEEKARLIQRKTQIDEQIAQLPTNVVRGRVALIKGFKAEQNQATDRITELDKVILEEKTKLIKTQAHIGPITYIASAFDLDTDNATKYLIYLIIFAFDPMAVSLTLAVNIAIRLRKEEKDREAANKAVLALAAPAVEPTKPEPQMLIEESGTQEPTLEEINQKLDEAYEPVEYEIKIPQENPAPEEVVEEETPPVVEDPVPVVEESVEEIIEEENIPVTDATEAQPEQELVEEVVQEVEDFVEEPIVEEFVEEPAVEPSKPSQARRRTRPYSSINTALSDAKLQELIQHYRWLKDKESSGEPLTQDDRWELSAIEEILRKNGLGLYLS